MDPTAPEYARSVLLVIDMQEDFADGGVSPVPGTLAVVPVIAELLEVYRAAGLPMVHAIRLYAGDDVDLPRRASVRVGSGPVRPGSSGSRILGPLRPPGADGLDAAALMAGTVQELGTNEFALWKPRWSAFYRTELADHPTKRGVSTVVITGCNFPNCPRATMFDASSRDFRVVAVRDAISGATPERLADARLIGVHDAPAADVGREASQSRGRPPSRPVAPGPHGADEGEGGEPRGHGE